MEEKSGEDFKKGGKLVQGVGALKSSGLEPPYELRKIFILTMIIGIRNLHV